MRDTLIILLMKIANFILKILGKQGGNVLGKIAKKLSPNIISTFNINCPVIAVTATNGKTMTNNAIASMLRQAGKHVICNTEGNNMETGILSMFLKTCSLTGKLKADYICLEVDESYVPIVFSKIHLDTLIVLDFFRDQLDRNGEVESLILKLEEFLKTYQGNLILNQDDPNVVRLGYANPQNSKVYYFHAEAYCHATKEITEAGEGKFCPLCKTRLMYDYYQYSHIGKFHCPNCEYGKQESYVTASNIDLEGKEFIANGIPFTMQSESIYVVYNFLAVISVANLYHIDIEDVQKALSTFELNKGRLEKLTIQGVPTIINLAKNPTGSNVSLRLLREDPEPKELLFVLNDKIADGFDVSWIWDINFNELGQVQRIITSGTRAYDMAIRIKTSGYPINIIEAELDLNKAVHKLYQTNVKKYIIANYTALEPTRKEILTLEKELGK